MYILGIETTGPYGSVAIIDEKGTILGYEVSADTMSHMQELIPMIDTMLKKTHIKKEEITYVAPSIGPGSFTGIRIGVSTARALAQVLGIRCIGVPTLESFLYKETKERASSEKNAAANQVICAILNARRGQVYGMIENYLQPGPYMLTEVLEAMEERAFAEGCTVKFYGDGIDAYAHKLEEFFAGREHLRTFAGEDKHQDAASVCRRALAKLAEEGETAATAYDELLPEYMRKAEAEQKLEAGQLPICRGPKQE
ncbi:MAG: tRNA (adenosine(37)-N6)-threonylcarbamoyltransferase complex dimerization subunit type 1 TsaB [Firmicutes bacterium]|nr:tRNA (adenosine(37)-N6)-threonylcarbamoyltransferase complex dimerization subunit type 1 TsaB [Bacillota bacterium]